MSLKIEFVEKADRPGANISALCREYKIARETGHKWLKRYRREGADGLDERSRRPKKSPLALPEDLILAIIEERERYPRRGPKKLYVQLRRKFDTQTPSVATIARVLRRFGMVRQRSKFRRLSLVEKPPSVQASASNDVWTVDFKGWWRARDGQRCEPLTVRDAFSRYVLATKVFKSPSMASTRAVFEQLFRSYGVPRYIQCDNGNPFINVQARGGLTRLSAWWVSLGITVVRSRQGCPQDNGAHERMHRDLSDDVQSHPSASILAEQRACDRWRQEFNHVRPHEALDGKTPSEVYKRSERRPRATKYAYPASWIVRVVTERGALNANGVQVSAGIPLAGHRVGLEPLDAMTHRLWFHNLDLGTVELGIPNVIVDDVSQQYLTARRKPGRRTKPSGRDGIKGKRPSAKRPPAVAARPLTPSRADGEGGYGKAKPSRSRRPRTHKIRKREPKGTQL